MTPAWPQQTVHNCDHITLKFKSFTVEAPIQCMSALPFPLETIRADFSDWPAGWDPVGGSHQHGQWEWWRCEASPNYYRPEVFHYGPRVLWISWVVNHCQQHISVCLGAAEPSEGFPRPIGKLLPNVDRYQSLQRCMNYAHWLIIQSQSTAKFYSDT